MTLSADDLKLRAIRVRQALAALYDPKPAPRVFPQGKKPELYDFAAEMIGNCPLTYLEFGVYEGTSIKRIAQRFPDPGARFVGFDSFQGLPEAWGRLSPGHFSVDGAIPAVSDKRVSFVKGWFQDTFPGFLASQPPLTGPVLIHYDADLYSATLFLLTTLWHQCREYYFICDEFADEAIAMYDFSLAYPVEIEFFASTLLADGRPIQTFGRLKNISYQQVYERSQQQRA